MTAHADEVSSNTLFGFWIYLMTDFILFATLFATYIVLRMGSHGFPTEKELYDLPHTLLETLILLTSTFSCGMGHLALLRQEKKSIFSWFGTTFCLGALFLGFVGGEWARLIYGLNVSWETNGMLSLYFSLVGIHGLHILFGLIFLIFFSVQLVRWGFIPMTIRRLTCFSMFWFFSYVVWIFFFTFVYLMGVA